MALFTALRHSWEFAESANVDDFIYANPTALDALNDRPFGITWDGTFFYVIDRDDAKVYKYNAAFVLQDSFNLDALNSNAWGITWDGTFFYVVDRDDAKVYKYNAAFVLQDSFNLDALNSIPYAIIWDGTFFYIVDGNDLKVYKYNAAFVLQDSFNLDALNDRPWGITWDGTFFYVTDWSDGKVYKYPYLRQKTIGGHRNTIVLYDGMSETFAVAHLTGVLEFWIRVKDAADEVKIILKDATGNACINVEIDTDKIICDGFDAVDPAFDNRNYHFSIDFDCTPNTYDFYVNDALEKAGQAFGVNDDGAGLTVLVIVTATDRNGYLDALGYDWDGGYSAGDNLLDTEDITDDITYCKITEEMGEPSFAELDIKGTSVTDFEAGHEIDFKDSDGDLSWTGIILFPESVLVGVSETIGKMKLLGLNNKFNNTYRKNFTTVRDSDYIIKNIIDNQLTRYHSYDDEIDNFTITYKYDLKTKIQKMFNYLAMLERAVLHYKPNSEIFFNKYNNLSATGLSWTQATSHVKITAYTPSANRHVTRAPVIGAYNNLKQVYYIGRASEDEEDQFGINELQPWRDPEITNYTEAKQLGVNLQEIYSLNTQMISMLVVGKKHIQVGYTIQLSWNILFNVSLANYLVTKRVWFPINDICELELTDNILTRKAFNLRVINKFYDEDAQEAYEDFDMPESTQDGTVVPLTSIAELRVFDAFAAALGLTLFLHQNASADIGAYKLLTTTFPDDAKTEVFNVTVVADDQEIEQWVTPAGGLGLVFLPHGIYHLHFHAYKFSGIKDVRLYFKVYSRTGGGAETLLGTSEESIIMPGAEADLEIHTEIHEQALNATDRIVVKIFAHLEGVGSNPVIYFYVEGTTLTRFSLPVPIGAGGGGNREIFPTLLHPSNADNAGNNNCYWGSGGIIFGITSRTGFSGRIWTYFKLPNDYVGGQDITFRVFVKILNGGNPDVIDYFIDTHYIRDGVARTAIASYNATWSEDFSAADLYHKEEITISGTNLLPNDVIKTDVLMEDDNNAQLIRLRSITLVVPVN